MRVLLLTTSFPVRQGMTSGVFVQRLVRSLPSWVRVTVLTPDASLPPDLPLKNDYRLVCFRYAPRGWQKLSHEPGGIPEAIRNRSAPLLLLPLLLFSMFVACLWQARKTDLIHANWSICGAIGGAAGFLLRKPVITTLRGTDFARAEDSLIFRWLLLVCLLLNRRIITVSISMNEKLRRAYPRYAHKFVFLPNGVDQELLEIGLTKPPHPDGMPLQILTIGNLVPNKGVDTVLRAIAKLPVEYNVRLEIVGDGIEKERLMLMAEKLGIASKTNFRGIVNPDQVAECYRRADIFVLASHSEGRPNVVLEAMSAGVAVVATCIDGISEIIENEKTGLLFPCGSDEQLMLHIRSLVLDKVKRTTLSTRAREYIVAAGLMWPETGRKYADIYTEVSTRALG